MKAHACAAAESTAERRSDAKVRCRAVERLDIARLLPMTHGKRHRSSVNAAFCSSYATVQAKTVSSTSPAGCRLCAWTLLVTRRTICQPFPLYAKACAWPQAATYIHGHHESVLRSHTWRTAANCAGYLLPSLRPDMRILDIGCGPGTITADLAKLVPQGAPQDFKGLPLQLHLNS